MNLYIPRQFKYKQLHRPRKQLRLAGSCSSVSFGAFGLKVIQKGWITSKQLEAVRKYLSKKLKRKGNVWIRSFPNFSITKKPIEVRMGRGKGNPEFWVTSVSPGTILFEISGVDENKAKELFADCAHKLPVLIKCSSKF